MTLFVILLNTLNSVVTILLFIISIDFDSLFDKNHDLGLSFDFFMTNVYNFGSLHITTILEVVFCTFSKLP